MDVQYLYNFILYKISLCLFKRITYHTGYCWSPHLSCLLDVFAGHVVRVQSLEARHVVEHVCDIVTQEAHWVWGGRGVLQC